MPKMSTEPPTTTRKKSRAPAKKPSVKLAAVGPKKKTRRAPKEGSPEKKRSLKKSGGSEPPRMRPKKEDALGLLIRKPNGTNRVFNQFRDDFGCRTLSVTNELQLIEGENDKFPTSIQKRGGVLRVDATDLERMEIRVGGIRFIFSEDGLEMYRGSRLLNAMAADLDDA